MFTPEQPTDSAAGESTPPVAAVADTELIRTYKAWKGSNIFLFGGRLIFGPDARSLILSIFMITAPVIVFCVYVAQRLMDEFPHRWGISIMVIVVVLTCLNMIALVVTSARDPGIIPRNAYPPEPEGCESNSQPRSALTPPMRLPRTKDMVINGIIVKLKYCDTCMLYRPPRSSHCSICNNCVDKFDHHCPWVGQCIGLRNYRFYFMFVSSATLICIYIHSFCWVYITRIMDSENISIWRAMIKTPASMSLIIYSFICVWFVGGLTIFHLYLISKNQSTYENFRYRYDRHANPFDKGVFENFRQVFFTKIAPTKNNFRAKVPKEPIVPPRAVGAGYTSPDMRKAIDDIEMGRKTVWEDNVSDSGGNEEGLSNDKDSEENGRSANVSQDLSRILPPEDIDGRSIMQPRESSLRTSGERWEISRESNGGDILIVDIHS